MVRTRWSRRRSGVCVPFRLSRSRSCEAAFAVHRLIVICAPRMSLRHEPIFAGRLHLRLRRAGVAQADSLTPLDARSHDTHSLACWTSTPMLLNSSNPRS